jgi:4-hydroxyphenylpyruvate dioxygenase
MDQKNPVGLDGIAFVEFAAPSERGHADLHRLFHALGFSRTRRHRERAVDLFEQNEIRVLVTREPGSFAEGFADEHGPSIPSMGWWVADERRAFTEALRRGARPYDGPHVVDAPAIWGIGDSLIYFVKKSDRPKWESEFIALEKPVWAPDRGFLVVDHLTNNVEKGTMKEWADFYRNVFGFTEVRYFDIRGEQTGLTSFALRSPCGKFCIPINEGSEEKSQIEEYLREYDGAGIQHLALLSNDLLESLEGLNEADVPTLDIDTDYYDTVFDRVPNVAEDHDRIERLQVLVDGDEEGYLLQIFTKNVIGPIFFEMIQRKNHLSFGEGNFTALFRSIERDQEKRGVL